MIKNRSYTKEILIVVTLASAGFTAYFAGENSRLYSEMEAQEQKIEQLQDEVSTYDKRLGMKNLELEEAINKYEASNKNFKELKEIADKQQKLLKEINADYQKALSDADNWKIKYYKLETDLKKN